MAGRRLARTLLLALAVLASASTAARADNSDQQLVAVVYANGGQQTFSTIVSSLAASCPTAGETLAEHGPGGELLTPQQVTGWPVGTLIDECLGIPAALAAAVTDVVIVQGSGLPETDTGSQLTPLDWQPGATEFPVVASDGTNLDYYRPWRGGTDDNAGDDVVIPSPSSLTLDVYTTGTYLPVTVGAPATAAVNAPVALSASVSGSADGVTYTWSFDGGSGTSTVPDPTVTFSAPGTYQVTVQASEPGGGGAGSATIVVGDATATTPSGSTTGPSTSTGTTPQAPPSPRAPTRRRKRTRRRRTRQRKHVATTTTPTTTLPTRTPTPPPPTTTLLSKPKPKPKATQSAPSRSPKPSTTTATAPATSTLAAPATSTPVPAASTTRSETPPAPSTPAPARHARKPHRRRTRPRRTLGSTSASPQAALVEGRLIADIEPLPVTTSPLVHAVGFAATAPSARRAAAGSPVPALAAALAVVLLFACGAARELRWARLRSSP